MKQSLGIVTVFVLGIVDLQAAKVPMSPKELEKEATYRLGQGYFSDYEGAKVQNRTVLGSSPRSSVHH